MEAYRDSAKSLKYLKYVCASYAFLSISFIVLLSTLWPKFNLIENVHFTSQFTVVAMVFLQLIGLFCVVPSSNFTIFKLMKAAVICVLTMPVLHFIMVLFGAPLSESVSETFTLSMLLTVCTMLPSMLLLGPSYQAFGKVFLLHRLDTGAEVAAHSVLLCSLVATWLGAFPIPLDWDRPWQVWPVSCLIGCLCGHMIGWLVAAGRIWILQLQKAKTKLR